MNIREKVGPNIEEALTKHGHEGDDLCWDISHTLLPQPNGFAVIHSIILSMRSPIPPNRLTLAMNLPDVMMFMDQEQTDKIILQMLLGLREIRAQVLAPANGGGGQHGGLIIPGQ